MIGSGFPDRGSSMDQLSLSVIIIWESFLDMVV